MDIPLTRGADDKVRLKIVDGHLMYERVEVYTGAVPWLFMSNEERAVVQKLANEQWERERIGSGDPPYSIGNDWLRDLDRALKPLNPAVTATQPD